MLLLLQLFQLLKAQRRAPQRTEQAVARTTVEVLTCQQEDVREHLVGFGTSRALQDASISAEVAGTVVWVSPRLEAGEVLAAAETVVRLDPQDYQRQSELSEIQVSLAQSAKAKAQQNLENLERRLAAAGAARYEDQAAATQQQSDSNHRRVSRRFLR